MKAQVIRKLPSTVMRTQDFTSMTMFERSINRQNDGAVDPHPVDHPKLIFNRSDASGFAILRAPNKKPTVSDGSRE